MAVFELNPALRTDRAFWQLDRTSAYIEWRCEFRDTSDRLRPGNESKVVRLRPDEVYDTQDRAVAAVMRRVTISSGGRGLRLFAEVTKRPTRDYDADAEIKARVATRSL